MPVYQKWSLNWSHSKVQTGDTHRQTEKCNRTHYHEQTRHRSHGKTPHYVTTGHWLITELASEFIKVTCMSASVEWVIIILLLSIMTVCVVVSNDQQWCAIVKSTSYVSATLTDNDYSDHCSDSSSFWNCRRKAVFSTLIAALLYGLWRQAYDKQLTRNS